MARPPHGDSVMLARGFRRLLHLHGRSKGAAGTSRGQYTAQPHCGPARLGRGRGELRGVPPLGREAALQRAPRQGPGIWALRRSRTRPRSLARGGVGAPHRERPGMEQFPPLFPPSVGRAGFRGLFHSTPPHTPHTHPHPAALSRLPVPAQRCPPPTPSCSRPPARGKKARCPRSPPRCSASLSSPRTPSPPPRALLGLQATICTGEGAPRRGGPHGTTRPVSSQAEALRGARWVPPEEGPLAERSLLGLQKGRPELACSLAPLLLHPSPFPGICGPVMLQHQHRCSFWPKVRLDTSARTAGLHQHCLGVFLLKQTVAHVGRPCSTHGFLLSSWLVGAACQRKLWHIFVVFRN